MNFNKCNNLYALYNSKKIYEKIFPIIENILKCYPYYHVWIKKDYDNFYYKIILSIENHKFLYNKLYIYKFCEFLHNIFEKYKNLIDIPNYDFIYNLNTIDSLKEIKKYTNFDLYIIGKRYNYQFYKICGDYDLCKHLIKNNNTNIKNIIFVLENYNSNKDLYEIYFNLYNKCYKIISYLCKKNYYLISCFKNNLRENNLLFYENKKKYNSVLLYGLRFNFFYTILDYCISYDDRLNYLFDYYFYTKKLFFKIMINVDYSLFKEEEIDKLLIFINKIKCDEHEEILKWIKTIRNL